MNTDVAATAKQQSSSSSSASLANPNAATAKPKDETSTISSSNAAPAAAAAHPAIARLNSQNNSITNFSRTDSHVDQLIQQKLVQRNRILSERSSSGRSPHHHQDDFEGKINRL